MTLHGKPYTSIGGYNCRMIYHFSINVLFKKQYYDDGKYGYRPMYYDGWLHSFCIYPIRIDWWKRPEIIKP